MADCSTSSNGSAFISKHGQCYDSESQEARTPTLSPSTSPCGEHRHLTRQLRRQSSHNADPWSPLLAAPLVALGLQTDDCPLLEDTGHDITDSDLKIFGRIRPLAQSAQSNAYLQYTNDYHDQWATITPTHRSSILTPMKSNDSKMKSMTNPRSTPAGAKTIRNAHEQNPNWGNRQFNLFLPQSGTSAMDLDLAYCGDGTRSGALGSPPPDTMPSNAPPMRRSRSGVRCSSSPLAPAAQEHRKRDRRTTTGSFREARPDIDSLRIVREDGQGSSLSTLSRLMSWDGRPRRHGPLSAEQRTQAAKQRKAKSVCLRCRRMKKAVSCVYCSAAQPFYL